MYGVILAGGSGTRFWPLSRAEYPKQLLKIFGDQTLIQATVTRVSGLIPLAKLYLATNPKQMEQIRFQLEEGPAAGIRYISEPGRRDTAAAIGLSALVLCKRDPEAVMAVLSADHFIQSPSVFESALLQAKTLAEKGYLVTLGAEPGRPETAYGYIQAGPPLKHFPSAHEVQRFTEKPNRVNAQKYCAAPNTFWNTGIFVWKASKILDEIKRFLPELSDGLQEIKAAMGSPSESETLERVYPALPAISIDYAVLERSSDLAVLPTDMGWEDVGSWNALDEVMPKDADGNILTGNTINIGSRNSIVYAGRRVVSVLGLEDMIVADTEDATLVCHKSHAQEVKQVVRHLRERAEDTHRIHRTVIRAWGSYTVLEEAPGYKIKRIEVKPRAKLSLQMHHKRSEHWVVVSGTARVTCGESVYTIHENQSTFVPMGVKHRLENPLDAPLQLVEVQSGGYLGEDDIVRFEDDYGRV